MTTSLFFNSGFTSKFETSVSTAVLGFTMYGLVIVVCAYLAIVSQFQSQGITLKPLSLYVLFLLLWAIPGFLLSEHITDLRANAGVILIGFGVMVTYLIGRSIPIFTIFAFAFPGYLMGIVACWAVILGKRYIMPDHVAPYSPSNIRAGLHDAGIREVVLAFGFLYGSVTLDAIGYITSDYRFLYLGVPPFLIFLGIALWVGHQVRMRGMVRGASRYS